MCPMPGDDVTPSVIPKPRPSHHSGPGYVANAKAPDFELDAPLREAAGGGKRPRRRGPLAQRD
jgi:hypothetical protein